MIYFSKGPYIELLDGSRMPGAAKALMRLLGKGALIDRLQRLDTRSVSAIVSLPLRITRLI